MISRFAFPTPILSGNGALEELPELLNALGVKRPLIVTDPGILGTSAMGLLRAILPDARIYSDVQPNPQERDVSEGAAAFTSHACDGVIGFGGGSALDVAKIIRVAAVREDGWQEVDYRETLPVLAPFVAIPTTAGTGSEVGRSSVITFSTTKRVLFHPALLAAQVILEPRVTEGLPPKLTAATGADALTHCLESFTSPVFHPLCDGIALEGLRLALEFLPKAVADGSDLHARSMMQIAAAMGGIAFQKDLGAAHSLSHPLSAHFGTHHGLANALCLPAVMRFNARHKPGLYERIGRTLGLANPSDTGVIETITSLFAEIGLTGGLQAHGIDPQALDKLVDAAFADPCHLTNPVAVTRDDLRLLYRESL
jgi:4-hydroxybutyrate dehydrogenase